MSLDDIGERDLIDEIRRMFETAGPRTLIGIGDDAAVIDVGGRLLCITTDTFTEWVHFRWDFISPFQMGAKALNATVSDCAAMGCAPRWITISLAAPGGTQIGRVRGLYEGMKDAAGRHGCDIVGGDTVSTLSDLCLSLTAVGEPFGARVLTRTGAEIGDDVFVTGTLGGPTAGLLLLRHEPELTLQDEFRFSVMRFLEPEARVAAARVLAGRFPVTSMIDISDGFSVDLHHLAKESGVGFHIDRGNFPVDPSVFAVADELRIPADLMVLHGGEEFELLFTLAPGEDERVVRELRDEAGLEVTRVGTVVPEDEGVLLMDETGEGQPIVEHGYEHFHDSGADSRTPPDRHS